MACQKTLPLSLKVEDMPLDSAIYSSANNAIFGCRGKWVYRFNAATGKVEASARVADDIVGISSICDHNGTIYYCAWETLVGKDAGLAQYPDNRDFWTINPTTLAATNTHILRTYNAASYSGGYMFGPAKVISDGAKLWGVLASGTYASTSYRVDPAVPAGLTTFAGGNFSSVGGCGTRGSDFAFSTFNNIIAFTQPYSTAADVYTYDMAGANVGTYSTPDKSFFNGITYASAIDAYYLTKGTNEIVKLNGATLTGATSLFILSAAAVPWRLKYQTNAGGPYPGKIFIPTWSNDTVEILDPTTDTIVAIKTGFSDPVDVVLTPTRAFAVQNSSVPLREITTT